MKSRIIVVMHYLEIGGAETALIGLLNALDPKRIEVDLFLHDHRGEMMQFIPKWVNLLPAIPEYTVLERPIVELVKRGFLFLALSRLYAKGLSSISYRKSKTTLPNDSYSDYSSKYTMSFLPFISPNTYYDLAISFCTPHRIVLDRVKARKKMAWIHTDYTRIWVDAPEELKVWSRYDYIASISGDVTKTFLQVFPSLESKIIEIENILSPKFVRERAELQDVSAELEGGGIRILTIARYSQQKNLDNVPDICRKLIEEMTKLLSVGRFSEAKNYDNVPDICKRIIKYLQADDSQNTDSVFPIKWYIIGYGGDEELIRQKIKEAGMENNVILLGKRSNPYPYIKACDIYVQPSRYEGKSVTVREAQMLCKPVVITNYPTASSQIKTGIDGLIVPMDNEGCAKAIAEFICNDSLQNDITRYLESHDYGNEMEVEKMYDILATQD